MKRPPSIIQDEKVCYITGVEFDMYPFDPHEPIGGSNRNNSIEDGLWFWVTRKAHRWLHDTEEGKKRNKELQAYMQRRWIDENYPLLEINEAIEMFRKRYFKNYL